jgi:hypothetical protein
LLVEVGDGTARVFFQQDFEPPLHCSSTTRSASAIAAWPLSGRRFDGTVKNRTSAREQGGDRADTLALLQTSRCSRIASVCGFQCIAATCYDLIAARLPI